MSGIWKDILYGLRMLRKYPLLSAIAVFTFALGIGLTTTVYSIVSGALLKGLPFEKPHQIVALVAIDRARSNAPGDPTIPDYEDWVRQQSTVSAVSAMEERTLNIVDDEGRPARYDAAAVEPGFFDIVRTSPAVGRRFEPADIQIGAPAVLIVSHQAWREQYGSDPQVVGRTVRANGAVATIVGVMPEGFVFPARVWYWTALQRDLATPRGAGPRYTALARLRDGVSLNRAHAELATIAARLATTHPESNRNVGADIYPLHRL